jgi:hypothetical protein
VKLGKNEPITKWACREKEKQLTKRSICMPLEHRLLEYRMVHEVKWPDIASQMCFVDHVRTENGDQMSRKWRAFVSRYDNRKQ